MNLTQLTSAFLVCGLLLTQNARVCHAQISSQDTSTGQTKAQEEAAQRFERGVELYRDGALEAALVEFERAYELVSDYRVLYNLARVQSERHHYVEAVHLYERYLKDGGDEIDDERRSTVNHELSVLKGRVAHLWVESNVAGAELFVNDISVGTLPLDGSLLINPGVTQIRLEKPGYETARQNMKVAVGESPRVSLNLSPLTASPAAGSEDPLSSSRPPPTRVARANYTPFWITAGTTVALAGAATAFGIIVINNEKKIDDEFDQNPVDSGRVDDLQSKGQTYAWLADGFALGALVSGGLSLYFLFKPPKAKSSAQIGKIHDLRFSPTLGGGTVSGRF